MQKVVFFSVSVVSDVAAKFNQEIFSELVEMAFKNYGWYGGLWWDTQGERFILNFILSKSPILESNYENYQKHKPPKLKPTDPEYQKIIQILDEIGQIIQKNVGIKRWYLEDSTLIN